MLKLRSVSLLAASVAAIVATSVAAAPVVGLDVLRTYNLVVLGDLTSSSEVEGRTFVGGNLNGNSSNYLIKELPKNSPNPTTPGLTVVGDVNGSHKNLNFGSGAIVGGNVNSGFNLNGPVQTVQVGGTIKNTNVNNNTVTSGLTASNPAFSQDLNQQKSLIETSMTGLSYDLSTLTANSQLTTNGNKGTFNAKPDASGVAVFTISSADLDKIGEIQFNLNGADTAIINVLGKSVVLNDNFLGGTNNLGEKVIWNFPEATSLSLTTAWGGSVLAPLASATTGNYIQGSGVFGSLNQNGEMHIGTYASSYAGPVAPGNPGGGSSSGGSVPVPEPGVIGILGLGLAAIAVWRRRATRAKA